MPSRYPPLPSIGAQGIFPHATSEQYSNNFSKLGNFDSLAAGDRYSLIDTRLQTAGKFVKRNILFEQCGYE